MAMQNGKHLAAYHAVPQIICVLYIESRAFQIRLCSLNRAEFGQAFKRSSTSYGH